MNLDKFPPWLYDIIIGWAIVIGFWLIVILLGIICIVIGNKYF